MHILNLKNKTGFLPDKILDFPRKSIDEPSMVLRQEESNSLPPSYRSSLILLIGFMVFFVLGIKSLDVQSLAETQDRVMNERLEEELLLLHRSLREVKISVEPKEEDETLQTEAKSLEILQLMTTANQGLRAFQKLNQAWEKSEERSLTNKLGPLFSTMKILQSSWSDFLEIEVPRQSLSYENRVLLSTVKAEVRVLLSLLNRLKPAEEEMILSLLGSELPKRWLILDSMTASGLEVLLDEGDPLIVRPANINLESKTLHADWQNTQKSTLTGLVKIHPRVLESVFETENTRNLFDENNSSEVSQKNFKRILHQVLSPPRLLKFLPDLEAAVKNKEIEVVVF